MIENGSIEVVVGEESTGLLITADDPLNEDDMDSEVNRLTGAVLEVEQENLHGAYGCLGVWTGKDKDGNDAKISVWRLER